ncbi:uncharacterized protein AB9X84_018841 isoform 1-T2 [Acanthopagrus schlegelii]
MCCHHFYQAKDTSDVPLFKVSMMKVWRIQRIVILRGCLSDSKEISGTVQVDPVPVQSSQQCSEAQSQPTLIPASATVKAQKQSLMNTVPAWSTEGLHQRRLSCPSSST